MAASGRQEEKGPASSSTSSALTRPWNKSTHPRPHLRLLGSRRRRRRRLLPVPRAASLLHHRPWLCVACGQGGIWVDELHCGVSCRRRVPPADPHASPRSSIDDRADLAHHRVCRDDSGRPPPVRFARVVAFVWGARHLHSIDRSDAAPRTHGPQEPHRCSACWPNARGRRGRIGRPHPTPTDAVTARSTTTPMPTKAAHAARPRNSISPDPIQRIHTTQGQGSHGARRGAAAGGHRLHDPGGGDGPARASGPLHPQRARGKRNSTPRPSTVHPPWPQPADLTPSSVIPRLQRNWEQALPESLGEFQQRRKEEIERVCSRYYAEFLGCVRPALLPCLDRCTKNRSLRACVLV